MSRHVSIAGRCRFVTPRLVVADCRPLIATAAERATFAARLLEILSPEVTRTLPEGWQDVGSTDRALDWIDARSAEGDVLTATIAATGGVAGLLLLHATGAESEPDRLEIRIGYLFARDCWGLGLGSELIAGLVGWCNDAGDVAALIGGVHRCNPASARVLLKNGFRPVPVGGAPAMLSYERTFAVGRSV